MKIPRIILAVALALAAFTHLAAAGFPAPLPEFKNEQELAQWRSEQNQAVEADEAAQSAVFYTGKPYDTSLSAYVFAFRNYDAELGRWTSLDPSGYSDGANNLLYVRNHVNSHFDRDGLIGKSIVWIYGYTGSEEPDEVADDVRAAVSELRAELQQLDTNSPSPKYLSDGDIFHYGSVSTAQGLGNFDDYQKMVLFAHGKQFDDRPSWNIGLGDTTGLPNEEEIRYTTAELQAFRGENRHLWIIGCGTGQIGIGDALNSARDFTKTYLYE